MGSAKAYFDSMFDSRGLDKSVSSGGYTLSTKVASNSCGEAAGIAVLEVAARQL